MIKRILLILLIPLLVSSCSKNNIEEITFSSWGSITEVQILENIISKFENENPNIKIKFLHIPQNYFQKIHLLFASKTEPDVIFINNLYLPIYAEKLEVLPAEMADNNIFYKQSIEALTIDGKLLAVPRDISTLLLYYNKNIISDEIFKNWNFETFFEEIQKATDNAHYGISYERDIYWAQPYIMTLGFEKGIDFYTKLEGKYAPTQAEKGSFTNAQMFLDGKLAFYLSGRWIYPKIYETANFPFGIAVFPGIVSADASGWAIAKNSKHKEQAKRFIQYLASKENMEYIASTGLIMPARRDASNLLNKDDEKAFHESIKKSKSVKINKDYAKKRDIANKKFFK